MVRKGIVDTHAAEIGDRTVCFVAISEHNEAKGITLRVPFLKDSSMDIGFTFWNWWKRLPLIE